MFVLRIEHPIRDFATWKAAFDGDPIGRQRSGVRRYRVLRPTDDPRYIVIDLDFEREAETKAFLTALENVWSRAELSPGLAREGGAVRPRARIVEEVEAGAY